LRAGGETGAQREKKQREGENEGLQRRVGANGNVIGRRWRNGPPIKRGWKGGNYIIWRRVSHEWYGGSVSI
jgi:hypothetical protein